MALCVFFLVLLLSLSAKRLEATASDDQTRFLSLMKKTLSGSMLANWDLNGTKAVCDYTGIGCNTHGYVVKIDLSGWSLSGSFPEGVCSYFPDLRILRLGHNRLHGKFPDSITNCSLLEELNMTFGHLSGTVPDLSPLISLKMLDLSNNYFTGDFPLSVTNLVNLEVLNLLENGGFNFWQMPNNFVNLTKLKYMFLSTCKIQGQIPAFIGNMTSLVDLELSGNFFTGKIPSELGLLKNLQLLELYYNQLVGEIPEELGNLTELRDLDISVNFLTGQVPKSLCSLPNLEVLQLYNNSLTGGIPEVIANSTTLRILSLYDNSLTGQVPKNLGRWSPMIAFDLSENQLSGELPTETCNGGKLLYFCVLDNMFTGGLPETYESCPSLLRLRVSRNRLQGSIPEGILGLPRISILDLGYNNLSGSLSKSIGNAKNLSELLLQRNMISGIVPPEISHAINLVKIDLSNNLLSGPIPSEIGNLKRLNSLVLQNNKLGSSVPETLSSLQSLNLLDLSNNQLTGNIPESLSDLLPNSINFSSNLLHGPIPKAFIKGGMLESFSNNPSLCVPNYLSSTDTNFNTCPQTYKHKKLIGTWVIWTSVGMVIIGGLLFMKRWFSKERNAIKHQDSFSSSYFSYDVKSFHRVSFDHYEIVEALVDKNIIDRGGSGTVYKIQLSNGENIAVKRLWRQRTKDPSSDDQVVINKELKTEVETLGCIRHKNIVKLYCYFSSLDSDLLVYEYMPNGNLWDSLHRGKNLLDWPTRHQIALGIAQGLAYLHHDLMPPIIHRDIKSTNILLDVNNHAKVADFGIAKVLRAQGGKDSTTTVVAGTYGYMAPEYAYSSKATTKCDVYSFGVVLMELITGKKPVEAEFGESKNIIHWVSTKVETKEGLMEVLDKQLSVSFKDEIIKVLRIAVRCTNKSPTLRPTMDEVVQFLVEADPCKLSSYKSSNNLKDKENVPKPPKKQYES